MRISYCSLQQIKILEHFWTCPRGGEFLQAKAIVAEPDKVLLSCARSARTWSLLPHRRCRNTDLRETDSRDRGADFLLPPELDPPAIWQWLHDFPREGLAELSTLENPLVECNADDQEDLTQKTQ